jgi:prephenate dehydrogenase
MQLKRLSIVGLGLMGGSVGLAVKARIKVCEIIGYDISKKAMEQASESRAVDHVADDLARSISDASLVLLAASPLQNEAIFKEIAGHLEPQTVLTDVGSIKRSVVELASGILPAPIKFVGSHPMAGSEQQGIESARADLFAGAVCAITPGSQTDAAAIEFVTQFWTQLGMSVTRLSPDQHDHLVARVSHLPHAAAAALVLIQNDASAALAGKGFLDATRIAAGDPALWSEIFRGNADYLIDAIDSLQVSLSGLKRKLKAADADELDRWLKDAAFYRRRMTTAQGGS